MTSGSDSRANAAGSVAPVQGARSRRQDRHRHHSPIFPSALQGSGPEVDVGGRLRVLRSHHGLSLRVLAEKSGLNVNTLSLIENGRTSPSVSTLQQLARALNVPIAAFFETDEAVQHVVFQKAGQRPRAAFAHGTAEDLGPGMNMQGGQPLLVTLRPGTDSGSAPIVHTGHEFVYCLEGQLTYTVEDRRFVLDAGDSLIFEAHLPHRWSNTGQTLTHSLLILCPTDENDRPTDRHFDTDTEVPTSPTTD
jgi:transcriptional regulator with XRE-family HTH domain